MRDARNIHGGKQDENISAGSGCTHSFPAVGEMRDSFGIFGGMRDLNSKLPFENLTRRDRDKGFESGWMAG